MFPEDVSFVDPCQWCGAGVGKFCSDNCSSDNYMDYPNDTELEIGHLSPSYDDEW